MVIYVDTSAAMKTLLDEPESEALTTALADALDAGDVLISSWLLHTELHCAVSRHQVAVPPAALETVLSAINLVDLTRADLVTAGQLEGRLRSHDAIHLAVAIRLEVDAMATYGDELAAAASAAGMAIVSPT